MFWNSIGEHNTQYGADIECNSNDLEKISQHFGILESLRVNNPGITSPFAYIGTWGSHFSWHTEVCTIAALSLTLFPVCMGRRPNEETKRF